MAAELTVLLTPVASFVAGFFTAVFAEPFRKWLTRPRLELAFQPIFGQGKNFISLTPEASDSQEKTYYVRASVQNKSRYIAKSCQAYLILIEYEMSAGNYHIIHQDPIPLNWSFLGSRSLDILPKLKFYIDVFSVSSFENRMVPRTQPIAAIWGTNLSSNGTYRYTVSVAGENIDPILQTITFNWCGSFEEIEVRDFQ